MAKQSACPSCGCRLHKMSGACKGSAYRSALENIELRIKMMIMRSKPDLKVLIESIYELQKEIELEE